MRLLLLLLAALIALAPAARGDGAAPAEPPAAPASEEPVFADLAGRTVRVSDHRGDVVLLNFWATYCGPCRTEMPDLQRLHEELGPKGLRVLGAAANGRDEGAMVLRVMGELGARFETWVWVSAKDIRHYGVGPGLPASILIDRQGRVRRSIRGVIDAAAVKPLLLEMLAEPAPAAATAMPASP